MSRMLVLAAAGVATAIAAVPATAQQWAAWRTIAYKTIDYGTDVDRIYVRGDRLYRQVKLCVFNAPLRIRDFDIRFANGQRQDVAVRQRIAAGTCTRNVDLYGNRRDIQWIRLRYERIPRGHPRPIVRVQAR